MLTDRLATLKKAESLARDGQIQEAIAEYLLLVDDQPGEWSAGNALGDLYLKSGQRDLAADVFVQMADSQREQGFVPKAVALYKKALKARGGDERALLGLADVAVAQEIFADARRYLEQVIALREARGDVEGAAACAERLAQMPARRAPGARPAVSALPIVPPPSRDGALVGALPPEADVPSIQADGDEALSLAGDALALAVPPASEADSDTHVGAQVPAAVSLDLVSVAAASTDPATPGAVSLEDDALTLSLDEPAGVASAATEPLVERLGVEPEAPAAFVVPDAPHTDAHDDGDAVDLGALLDAPIASAPAPEAVTRRPAPAPAPPPTPAPAPAPPPPVAAPVPPTARVAPRAPAAPAPPAVPATPAVPARVPAQPPRAPVAPVSDPFAALTPVPSVGDEAGQPDADALVAELEAAAQVPALRFQASAQLGRLLAERGDLPGAAGWLERAAQEPAPVPEHGLSVVYDLAVICERMGHAARALALFAEIESESSGYRDVTARVARLTAGGGGPGA